jgi:hypothetical protein
MHDEVLQKEHMSAYLIALSTFWEKPPKVTSGGCFIDHQSLA